MIENKKDINNETFDYQFKIVLLGDSEVGKSKIVSNYLNGGIPFKVDPTNGWKSDPKVINTKGKKIIVFQITDTPTSLMTYCGCKYFLNTSKDKLAQDLYWVIQRIINNDIDYYTDECRTVLT